MYNKDKDSLKLKHRMFAVLVTLALGISTVVGCGAKEKADPGATTEEDAAAESMETDVGTSGNIAASTEPAAQAATESNVGSDADKADAEDLPALAYKTAEERQNQGKPDLDRLRGTLDSNQFLVIEELSNDPGCEWPVDKITRSSNNAFVKLKGTLYEVFFYNEPDYEFVYFPGDELPEGYEVKVTEDYEVVIVDNTLFGEGHKNATCSPVYIAMDDGSGKIAYEKFYGGMQLKPEYHWDEEKNTCVDESGKPIGDQPAGEFVLKPGMYVELIPPCQYSYDDSYKVYQYLIREDLEALPEETVLADEVAHY